MYMQGLNGTMQYKRKANVASASTSNKAITYRDTRVTTNKSGHVHFPYTPGDKAHQTLLLLLWDS